MEVDLAVGGCEFGVLVVGMWLGLFWVSGLAVLVVVLWVFDGC